jgi:SHAQKYF class myb-like DNA-binding protein
MWLPQILHRGRASAFPCVLLLQNVFSYYRMCSLTTYRRYWTEEEHQRFLDAIQNYGHKDVKAIASVVGTRSATQVVVCICLCLCLCLCLCTQSVVCMCMCVCLCMRMCMSKDVKAIASVVDTLTSCTQVHRGASNLFYSNPMYTRTRSRCDHMRNITSSRFFRGHAARTRTPDCPTHLTSRLIPTAMTWYVVTHMCVYTSHTRIYVYTSHTHACLCMVIS